MSVLSGSEGERLRRAVVVHHHMRTLADDAWADVAKAARACVRSGVHVADVASVLDVPEQEVRLWAIGS